MYACVVHQAGDLRIEEREPRLPGAGEIVVAVALGGICGSDLHYYHRGSVGDFHLREPLVLGHEVVGRVSALGSGGPPIGTEVAIHPATPCGSCAECARDRRNICANTNYLGSAARMPHIQGGFSQQLIVPAAQVRPLPVGLDLRRAVLAEPLSVAIHAVRQADDVSGKRVLGNLAVTRELTLRGAFRFDHEFDDALTLLADGLKVDPIITHVFPLTEAVQAFELAGDRAAASKVLLDLG